MLHKHLKRLLSLQSDNLCYGEARKKFTDTYMIVNGKIARIKDISWATKTLALETIKGESYETEIKELEVFLPDSGMYPISSGQAIYITKTPKRQWLKSYSDTYYDFHIAGKCLNKKRPTKVIEILSDIHKAKRVDIFVDSEKYIWYHRNKIGYVKDSNTLICEDSRYIQELKDWSRDT